jgi:hypothetical protein
LCQAQLNATGKTLYKQAKKMPGANLIAGLNKKNEK